MLVKFNKKISLVNHATSLTNTQHDIIIPKSHFHLQMFGSVFISINNKQIRLKLEGVVVG